MSIDHFSINKIFRSLFAIGLIVYCSNGQDYGFDPCEDVEDGEWVRGPINCAHYILCDVDEDERFEGFCEDGLYFDPETQQCDDAESVECESDNMAGSCPQIDNPANIVFVSSLKSCSEYYLCYHGIALEMHCTDSLHFNPMTNRCDFPRNVNCMLAPSDPPQCTSDIQSEIYPHPTQCDYYYYCRRGYLSIQQCPFFYYFDASTKVCRFRNGYQC